MKPNEKQVKPTTFTREDIPHDVEEAIAIEWASKNIGIGQNMANRYKEIVNKYPTWFPGSKYLK